MPRQAYLFKLESWGKVIFRIINISHGNINWASRIRSILQKEHWKFLMMMWSPWWYDNHISSMIHYYVVILLSACAKMFLKSDFLWRMFNISSSTIIIKYLSKPLKGYGIKTASWINSTSKKTRPGSIPMTSSSNTSLLEKSKDSSFGRE